MDTASLSNPDFPLSILSSRSHSLYSTREPVPGTPSYNLIPTPSNSLLMLIDSLATVGVLLAAYAAIVLHIAPGKLLADIIVPLEVLGCEIAVSVGIDFVKIRMAGGCVLLSALPTSSEYAVVNEKMHCGARQRSKINCFQYILLDFRMSSAASLKINSNYCALCRTRAFRCDQAPNTDHLCETSRAKIQQLATPTGVQIRRLLTDAVLNIRQAPGAQLRLSLSFLIRGNTLFRRYKMLPMCPERTSRADWQGGN